MQMIISVFGLTRRKFYFLATMFLVARQLFLIRVSNNFASLFECSFRSLFWAATEACYVVCVGGPRRKSVSDWSGSTNGWFICVGWVFCLWLIGKIEGGATYTKNIKTFVNRINYLREYIKYITHVYATTVIGTRF